MKKLFTTRIGLVLRFLLTLSFCTAPAFAAEKAIHADDLNLDGFGEFKSITTPYLEEDEQDAEPLDLIVIDRSAYDVSLDVEVSHYLSYPVTTGNLVSGDYVGYIKDSSNTIVELWILNPDDRKENVGSVGVNRQQSVSSPKPSSASGSQKIRKEGDVWVN